MENKFDMRIMPLGDIYKFYGRCYHINEQNFEIETDVKIEHVATIEEAIAIQSEFISKNTEAASIEETVITETIGEVIPTENI
jgi:hypothetical protein